MKRLLFSLLLLTGLAATAAVPDFSAVGMEEAEEFLPVEQAFRLQAKPDGANALTLEWTVAPGYALYRDRIQAGSDKAGVALAPIAFASHAIFKDDPSFGRVAVFHDAAKATLRLANLPKDRAGQPLSVWVRYQGCADAGLCYPPQTVQLSLPRPQAVTDAAAAKAAVASRGLLLPAAGAATVATTADAASPLSGDAVAGAPRSLAAMDGAGSNGVVVPLAAAAGPRVESAAAPASPAAATDFEDAGGIAGFLGRSSLALVLLTFFALGLGLTFTPCVFPMMPILSGLIAGEDQATLTTARAFRLSLAYVLGMATTYALVGTLVGYFGARANVALWLQTPAVLIGFALVFVLLAFSMFGFYELQLPSFLRDRLDALSRRQQGGRLAGVFIMGVLSALVVSPCVSAPLAGTLVYISTTGDAVLGGLALLALGLGMGAPLVLIGTSGGKLLPRAGNWMLVVKAVFGVGLLGVAIWLVARVVPGPVALALWALLFGISAIYLGALEAADGGWQRFGKGLGVMFLLYATFLFAGALTGQDDPLRPLGAFTQRAAVVAASGAPAPERVAFQRITSAAQLHAALAEASRAGRATVVDFYADWCAACQQMERTTFRDARVVSLLAPRTRLQLDLSENTDEQRRLLEVFHLYGPPAMLFFNAQGAEERPLRVQSEISADALRRRLGV